MGDEIGLGKTIEAILVVKMLEKRDGVRRVLLLVPRILLEQWKSELKRFGVRVKVITRENLPLLAQQGFPDEWYIASIDLVKREKHRYMIVDVKWDVIIVDEAHRVGKTRSGRKNITQRYELVEELAKHPNRNIILLSATPHRGHAHDYIARLKLVDHYLIGERELDNDVFYRLTLDSIVMRRTKIDVNEVYEHKQVFKEAKFVARVINATREEAKFNELLFNFLRDKILKYYEYVGEEPKALPLLLALIAKRASSSPRAAMLTLERMLHKRSLVIEGRASSLSDANELDKEAESIIESYLSPGFEDYGEGSDTESFEPDEPINKFVEKCGTLLDKDDFMKIEKLFTLAQSISERHDSRLKGVFKLMEEHLGKGDSIVVFTEYKDTAKYIYEKLQREKPDIARYSALITSDGVIIPYWTQRRKPGIEDLKRSLQSGRVKLIISTDVASEGLNLQVANVIINYEPTWSPIKVEQRLGRVWRLGQEKEVTSYTLFLSIQSDKDVLDILYKKLLAWGRSLQEARVAIGEEVVIDMMTEDGSTTIPIDAAKGTPKYSEYKALLTYIQEGRSALEHYVQSIINALSSLKKNLEKVGLTRKNISFKIENLLTDVLGDFRGDDANRILKELFILVAKLSNQDVRVSGSRVFSSRSKLNNIHDFYSSALSLIPDTRNGARPVYIVSSAQLEDLKELHLFKVTIFFNNKPIYSETTGVGVKSNSIEVLRGKALLETIVSALSPDRILASAEEYYVPSELLKEFSVRASKNVLYKVAPTAVKELIDYMSKLEKLGLSASHKDWEPKYKGLYKDKTEYLGTIIFTSSPETGLGSPPPIKIKEIEEEAMRISIEYEKNSGRVPEDVSMREHFDILSRDPKTGELRFIEVKGKSGQNLVVELTETEYKVAQEKGGSYWLYIVYGIGGGKPRLMAVRDPINNMNWRPINITRYMFSPE